MLHPDWSQHLYKSSVFLHPIQIAGTMEYQHLVPSVHDQYSEKLAKYQSTQPPKKSPFLFLHQMLHVVSVMNQIKTSGLERCELFILICLVSGLFLNHVAGSLRAT